MQEALTDTRRGRAVAMHNRFELSVEFWTIVHKPCGPFGGALPPGLAGYLSRQSLLLDARGGANSSMMALSNIVSYTIGKEG